MSTFHSVVRPRPSSSPVEYSLDGVSLNVIVEILFSGRLEAKEWMVNVTCCSSWRLAQSASWRESES
jgi:hypothetical protein